MQGSFSQWGAGSALKRLRALLPFVVAYQPLALQLVGRVLLHAALVGAVVGLASSLFFLIIEVTERIVLEGWGGYRALRAAGEEIIHYQGDTQLRLGVLWFLPALGGLLAGLLSIKVPEIQGGGADATITAFHKYNGVIRRRVPLFKALATIATLSFGGSGGREGPAIQIGGGLGSTIGRYLRVTPRERRVLLVAGAAAGISAIFRTPLGAALLAAEVLHQDDFETDALVPSVLASVVAYSVFISFYGESHLFDHAARYPFVPEHLPLYALLAVVISVVASFFVGTLSFVNKVTAKLNLPIWAKPALGGLCLGVTISMLMVVFAAHYGVEGHGLGILGSGYGAAQLAITGNNWFLQGWSGVQFLLIIALLKIVATSLTVGSGGSAGDFGPSLVVGGLVGGAFGRAATLLFDDPRLDPGAFALVGMGTFYGGLAHVPLAALVLVCELAGSYDLLVPLMLCEGIAYVALRERKLYPAQPKTRRESPAHRDDLILDVLRDVQVKQILKREHPYVSFSHDTPATEVIAKIDQADWQDTFPVLSAERQLMGVVTSDIHRWIAHSAELKGAKTAEQLMRKAPCVLEDEDLHTALEKFLEHRVREIIVVNHVGKILGFLDEAEITQAYHSLTASLDAESSTSTAS